MIILDFDHEKKKIILIKIIFLIMIKNDFDLKFFFDHDNKNFGDQKKSYQKHYVEHDQTFFFDHDQKNYLD